MDIDEETSAEYRTPRRTLVLDDRDEFPWHEEAKQIARDLQQSFIEAQQTNDEARIIYTNDAMQDYDYDRN